MSAPRSVTVYDTPSGMGGSFTVSIDRDIDPETVEVRVWYGRATLHGWERWRDWHGYVFTTRRDALTMERRMPLFKDGYASHAGKLTTTVDTHQNSN